MNPVLVCHATHGLSHSLYPWLRINQVPVIKTYISICWLPWCEHVNNILDWFFPNNDSIIFKNKNPTWAQRISNIMVLTNS